MQVRCDMPPDVLLFACFAGEEACMAEELG